MPNICFSKNNLFIIIIIIIFIFVYIITHINNKYLKKINKHLHKNNNLLNNLLDNNLSNYNLSNNNLSNNNLLDNNLLDNNILDNNILDNNEIIKNNIIRDNLVLKDNLYPPLNRDPNNIILSYNMFNYKTRDSYDTYHLVGNLTRKTDNF